MRAEPVAENRKEVSWPAGKRQPRVGFILILGLGCSFFAGSTPLFAQADAERQPRRSNASASVSAASEMRTSGVSLKSRCARCHDADGTGKSTRSNFSEIPDFTSHRWQASRSDAQLRASILDGKGSHMPAFRDKISDKEARETIALVRKLDPDSPAVRADRSMDDFEERYRQLQQELQDLKKQFHELSPPPRKP
jgi:mono/diheme cytochrome c family protein